MKPARQLSIVHALLFASLLASSSESRPAGYEQQEQPATSSNNHNEFQPIAKQTGQFKFTRHAEAHMELVKIAQSGSGNNVTCNDGSPIGYYKRLNSHSKSWIIYLQGGGFCSSEESCQFRWQRSPDLMSSNYWPKSKIVDGILSSELQDNPYLWNANHIYVPYCSSDSWTGLAGAGPAAAAAGSSSGTFAFMGSKILERVLESLYEDLPRESSLHEAKFILLAGGSAGATGVILNLDKVSAFVEQKALASFESSVGLSNCPDCNATKQAPTVRGLADSGWFLDNEPYDYSRNEPYFANRQQFDSFPAGTQTGSEEAAAAADCDRARCTPLQSIKQAMRFWNGQVPETCRNQHPNEPWRCYFGYRAHQTLKTPLFVVQWIYDEAQLLIDNIMRPDTSDQWNYVSRLASEVRASLENVTALFAPSCFSHNLITKRSWNQININGFKLPHLLNSWEEQSLLETSAPATAAITPDTAAQQSNANLNSNPPPAPQPTFDALVMMRQTNQQQFNEPAPNMVRLPGSQSSQQRASGQPATGAGSTNRLRTRKRKRNNQQQRQKQARQKQQTSTTTETSQPAAPATESLQQLTRDNPNELTTAANNNNPMQDLLSLVDRSLISSDILFSATSNRDVANGRLGRSTILDDTTLMLTNNVPDDANLSASSGGDHQQASGRPSKLLWPIGLDSLATEARPAPNRYPIPDRFRLIDSCGWPQCNRDCPNFEPDLSFGAIV